MLPNKTIISALVLFKLNKNMLPSGQISNAFTGYIMQVRYFIFMKPKRSKRDRGPHILHFVLRKNIPFKEQHLSFSSFSLMRRKKKPSLIFRQRGPWLAFLTQALGLQNILINHYIYSSTQCIWSLQPPEIHLWQPSLLSSVGILWNWRFVWEWVGNAPTVGKLVIIQGLASLSEGVIVAVVLLVGWSSLGYSLIRCLLQLLYQWRKALAWIACRLRHPHPPLQHLLGFQQMIILINSPMGTSLTV